MHKPDRAKIPKPLQALNWIEMPEGAEWCDGMTLLVAVPVSNLVNWAYEFSVVRIFCDESRFDLVCNGCSGGWGWDLEDADYFVEIR